MTAEVRYERLRPRQIREAREKTPVAYLPLGTIEWHGFHNPVGLDTLKIHELCIRCAQAGGGLVFPPQYFGEPREEGLIEAHAGDRAEVARAMGLDPGNFSPGYMRRSPAEEVSGYQWLLLHMLNEVRSLGFKVVVLAAGHYPLIDHARAAACIFHQQRYGTKRESVIPWVFTGYELVRDRYPYAGDHAAYWETSLLMALIPGLTDLSELPGNSDEWPLGTGGARKPQEASAEKGREYVAAIVEKVLEQVRSRLEHPGDYMGHGLIL